MEPSNFRYNPYDDIPTGVEITERHVIPANSPYYIRLNEVPQKTSPSTLAVKEITNVGTSVTYGQTFNEVAATPAAGEFWPDCNTGANGDENWNTGLIAFNAVDAGKIIEVTYTGTGTLAAVNSNHWPSWYLDRGNGVAGDIVVTKNDKWKETQLSASCDNSQTTINVADNSKLNEGMVLLIDSEKMLITALREGGVVSVTRGYNSTAKASHNNNAIVYVMGAKITIDKLNAKSLYVGEESTLYTYGIPIFVQESVVVKGTIDARGQCGFEAKRSNLGRGGFPNGGNGSDIAGGDRRKGDNGGTAFGGGGGGTAYNNGSTSNTGGNGLGGNGNVFGFNYVGTPDANLLTILNKQLYQYLCCGAGGGGGCCGEAIGETGSGGGGGGCGMIIVANEITVTGKLTTKGGKSSIGHAFSIGSGNGINGSGGPGGGGSILLIANNISCSASNVDVSSGELAHPEYEGKTEYAKGYSGLLWKVNLNAL